LPRLGKIVSVHGCFWHNHGCRHGRRAPAANAQYWEAKRRGNRERDRSARRKLRRDGWRVLTIWECQMKNRARLAERVKKFLCE
jgi:DNA mismatch endonuclease (patch repair protein)